MKKIILCIMVLWVSSVFFSPLACAGDDGDVATPVAEKKEKPKSTRSKYLKGNAVHTSIGAGGSLPKGGLVTLYTSSLSDKTNGERGYTGSDVYSQAHMFRVRYGLTNHWEIKTNIAYLNNGSRNPSPPNKPDNIEGLGDQSIGIVYAPLQLHQGDPVAISFGANINLPTGLYGKNHIAGNGVWGGQLSAGIGGFATDNLRLSTEILWSMAFERGNQKVRRGDQYQWNAMARYLFDWFDIGIESAYVHSENGDKRTPRGMVNLKNGGTEWHVGPTMNFAIDPLGMWAGVGAYFPVLQDKNSPSAVDDVQYHFKLAKEW